MTNAERQYLLNNRKKPVEELAEGLGWSKELVEEALRELPPETPDMFQRFQMKAGTVCMTPAASLATDVDYKSAAAKSAADAKKQSRGGVGPIYPEGQAPAGE